MVHFEDTVKIVLTTIGIERPPIFNDHFETLPTTFLLLFVIELWDYLVLATYGHAFDQNFAFLRPHFEPNF